MYRIMWHSRFDNLIRRGCRTTFDSLYSFYILSIIVIMRIYQSRIVLFCRDVFVYILAAYYAIEQNIGGANKNNDITHLEVTKYIG